MKCLVLALLAAVALSATTDQCTSYCAVYTNNCTGVYDIYETTQACMDECMQWPNDADCADPCTSGNSYECRAYHIGVDPPSTHCVHGGPASLPLVSGTCVMAGVSGSSYETSNTLVDDLCNTLTTSCPTFISASQVFCNNVMQHVTGATDSSWYPDGTTTAGEQFPLTAAFAGANTLACRRYHAQVARDPTISSTHCWHAVAGQQPGESEQCGSICDFYCDIMFNVCDLPHEFCNTNVDPSQNFCTMFPVDESGTLLPMSTSGQTINCRIYHAMVAAQFPAGSADRDAHCEHASYQSTPDTCGSASAIGANVALVALMAIFAALFN